MGRPVVLPALIPDIQAVYGVYFASFAAEPMGRLMLDVMFPPSSKKDATTATIISPPQTPPVDDEESKTASYMQAKVGGDHQQQQQQQKSLDDSSIRNPYEDDPSFRTAHAAGVLSYWHVADSQYTFKCVDASTGEVIGMALGDILLRERADPAERAFHGLPWIEDAAARERAERVVRPLAEMRERLFGEKKHIYCHVMGVKPSHQGRQAGRALIEFATDLAARLSLPLYFESSPSVLGLYLKMGFERLPESVVHAAELLGTDGDVEVPLMVKMPPAAGGMGFAEWRERGCPDFAVA